MKIIYIVILLFLTVSCANTTTGLEPTVHSSGFDNAKIIEIAPHGNACTNIKCTGFGLQWSSKYPDEAYMVVQVFNDLKAIFGVQLNIDGEILELKEGQLLTQTEVNGTIQNSSKAFEISMANLEKISHAKRVWMRVITPAGAVEDAIIDGEKDSKSFHALKRFLAKVKSA